MQKHDSGEPIDAEGATRYLLYAAFNMQEIVSALEDERYLGSLSHQDLPDLRRMFDALSLRLTEICEREEEENLRPVTIECEEQFEDLDAARYHFRTLADRATERLEVINSQVSTLEKEVARREVLGRRRPHSRPPLNALFFLYLFLEKRGREEAVGDALEDYARHVKRLGKVRANLLFWKEVAICGWPFIKRLAAKTAGLILLGEWLRKLTH